MFTSLTLRYIGDLLDPQTITTSLGVLPTACGRKGDSVNSTTGKKRLLKNGFWEWSTKDDGYGAATQRNDSGILIQLDKQVYEFERVFCEAMGLLNTQSNCLYSWIDIHVIEDDEDSSISFPLSNKSLVILSNTGLLVDFTVRK